MICRQCLRSLARQRPPQRAARPLSSSTAARSDSVLAAPRGPASASHPEGAPAATSTGLAQPFSTPLSPAPPTASARGEPPAAAKKRPNSSIPAGHPLRGLGWLKGQDAPVARPDEEYPAWLWTLLDREQGAARKQEASAAPSDEYGGTRKSRQRARKEAAKIARMNPESLEPQVPLELQTVDLPAGDGTVDGALAAEDARQELTGAMRTARRKAIKEANFLKTMR